MVIIQPNDAFNCSFQCNPPQRIYNVLKYFDSDICLFRWGAHNNFAGVIFNGKKYKKFEISCFCHCKALEYVFKDVGLELIEQLLAYSPDSKKYNSFLQSL